MNLNRDTSDAQGDSRERTAEVRLRVRPRCPRIVRAMLDAPWAIMPDKLDAIAEFIELRAVEGWGLPQAELEVYAGRMEGRTATRSRGAVAVIPVIGTLIARANMVSDMSGGTSTQAISREFAAAVDNPQVSSIVLDIDSPGGVVSGVQEFADQIAAAREVKPVVAVANSLAASAAYWLGSQASEFVVTPSGQVGSIGVVAMHQDVSKRLEAEGVRSTIISAGKYKVEGNQFEPLGDEARAAMQAQVDTFYEAFVAAVARGRGVQPSTVRSGFGQGRTVLAKEAVRYGMADRVATLDETITRLLNRRPPMNSGQAAAIGADGLDAIDASLESLKASAAGVAADGDRFFQEGPRQDPENESAARTAVPAAHVSHLRRKLALFT